MIQGTSLPPLRICVLGSDEIIAHLVRPFVELIASQPRAWTDLKLFIVPIDDVSQGKVIFHKR
jgi:hypothetical protein